MAKPTRAQEVARALRAMALGAALGLALGVSARASERRRVHQGAGLRGPARARHGIGR